MPVGDQGLAGGVKHKLLIGTPMPSPKQRHAQPAPSVSDERSSLKSAVDWEDQTG